jgi:hypothetical protein
VLFEVDSVSSGVTRLSYHHSAQSKLPLSI